MGRSAIVAHAATRRADAADHGHAPGSTEAPRVHRASRNATAVLNDVILRGRVVGVPLIATDGFEYSVGVIERLFGSACVYGHVLKTRRAVADALATVRASRASRASVTTKDAFEFLVLTAARSGEVRLATWDEMDLDAGIWTIPGARMKAKRDHRVPLSGRALAILHDARRRSNGTGLVFRSLRGKPLSNTTLSKLIKELGLAAVPHGFRSSFRDWAAERTNTPREVVEAAFAHTVHNPTEAAYARSDLFERRRHLIDDWAAYLSG